MFGLGRGGNRYYAIDIASPLDPGLAWSFQLPDADVASRAEPVVTRLAITDSGQTAGNWVVLVAGGYDPRFDARGATGSGHGAVLRVLDALTGRELWSMGGDGATYSLAGLASLASAPRALDLDGNGYLDRAYLLDVTGSLWRLDFANARPPTALAAGRRLARLGAGTQRFFATPDAALVRIGNEPRLALSMGSGWLTRPRDESSEDRAYVVFDRTDGSTIAEVSETDLYDATDDPGAMPLDAAGWFVRLDAHGAGEKVIGSTVTFDHVLRFQTYQPEAADPSAPCGPPAAIVRRYAFDVRNALPREFAVESEEDDADSDDVTGLPVDLRFGFPGLWSDLCEGCRPRPFGLVGGNAFDPGYAGDPVRTSWRKLAPPPASP
jgi:type IV pilus assembly protein PilY1